MHKVIIGAILFTIFNIILQEVFKLQSHQWYSIVSYILGVSIGIWINGDIK